MEQAIGREDIINIVINGVPEVTDGKDKMIRVVDIKGAKMTKATWRVDIILEEVMKSHRDKEDIGLEEAMMIIGDKVLVDTDQDEVTMISETRHIPEEIQGTIEKGIRQIVEMVIRMRIKDHGGPGET